VALARDSIIGFVKGHPEPICAACLGRTLRLLFEHVLDAWSDIRLRGDFPIRSGLCSACGELNVDVIHRGLTQRAPGQILN
jgi:hypothetical protein